MIRTLAGVALVILGGSSLLAAQDEAAPARGGAGIGGPVAHVSVVRVLCPAAYTSGTGFLHRSGRVITAAHVVSTCPQGGVAIETSTGAVVAVDAIERDDRLDLALLTPARPLAGDALALSGRESLEVGLQVSAWGFPEGYAGVHPLLTVGYVAGATDVAAAGGASRRLIVNAAFNAGHSGSPVLDTRDGTVIGVVSARLMPAPALIEAGLKALAAQREGFTFNYTAPDGTQETMTESQLVGSALAYLRSQVQIGIGSVVLHEDLRRFLLAQGLDP